VPEACGTRIQLVVVKSWMLLREGETCTCPETVSASDALMLTAPADVGGGTGTGVA